MFNFGCEVPISVSMHWLHALSDLFADFFFCTNAPVCATLSVRLTRGYPHLPPHRGSHQNRVGSRVAPLTPHWRDPAAHSPTLSQLQ